MIATGAGLLVAWKWDAVTSASRAASRSLAEMSAVRAAVQERHPRAQVFVGFHRAASANETALVVRVVNEPAFADSLGEHGRPQAREVARLARRHLPASSGYTSITIVFQNAAGGPALNVSRGHSFVFPVSELQ